MPHAHPHLLKIARDTERGSAHPGLVGLNRNERVTPFPDEVFAQIMATLRPSHLSAYPDPAPLCERLARLTGLPEDHLIVTPGSDGAIRRLFQCFVESGARVVVPDPTYAMYNIYCRIFQGTLIKVPYGQDLNLDVDRFIAAITPGTRLVGLANPGQPTGTMIAQDDIRRIVAAAHAVDALCIIDEAYYPFCPDTAVALVHEFDNLAVTRTFSKIGGIAGLRVGYAATSPQIVKIMDTVRGASEVNGVGLAIACYLLDHPRIMQDFKSSVAEGRAVLVQTAKRLGFGVPDSYGNFQVLRCTPEMSPARIEAGLRDRGYLIKTNFAPPMDDCIRITLDAPSIMEPFAAILDEVVGNMLRAD